MHLRTILLGAMMCLSVLPADAQVYPAAPQNSQETDGIDGNGQNGPQAGFVRIPAGNSGYIDPQIPAGSAPQYCRYVTNGNRAENVVPVGSVIEWQHYRAGKVNGLPPPGITEQICCRPQSVSLCTASTSGPQTQTLPYTINAGSQTLTAGCTNASGSYTETQVWTCGTTGSGVLADGYWTESNDTTKQTLTCPSKQVVMQTDAGPYAAYTSYDGDDTFCGGTLPVTPAGQYATVFQNGPPYVAAVTTALQNDGSGNPAVYGSGDVTYYCDLTGAWQYFNGVCVAGYTAKNCPRDDVYWTDPTTGIQCYGLTTAAANGSTENVASITASGYGTGSAVAVCNGYSSDEFSGRDGPGDWIVQSGTCTSAGCTPNGTLTVQGVCSSACTQQLVDSCGNPAGTQGCFGGNCFYQNNTQYDLDRAIQVQNQAAQAAAQAAATAAAAQAAAQAAAAAAAAAAATPTCTPGTPGTCTASCQSASTDSCGNTTYSTCTGGACNAGSGTSSGSGSSGGTGTTTPTIIVCTPDGTVTETPSTCPANCQQEMTDSCGNSLGVRYCTGGACPTTTGCSGSTTTTGPCSVNCGTGIAVVTTKDCNGNITNQTTISCTGSQPAQTPTTTLGACSTSCGTGTQSITTTDFCGTPTVSTITCIESSGCAAPACGSGNADSCSASCAVGTASVTFCGGGSTQTGNSLGWTCSSGSLSVGCSAHSGDKS